MMTLPAWLVYLGIVLILGLWIGGGHGWVQAFEKDTGETVARSGVALVTAIWPLIAVVSILQANLGSVVQSPELPEEGSDS